MDLSRLLDDLGFFVRVTIKWGARADEMSVAMYIINAPDRRPELVGTDP